MQTNRSTRHACIYILHFDEPLAHARHYAGCTEYLRERLVRHASGHGSHLCRVLHERGRHWQVGGLYTCTLAEMRRIERDLKDTHNVKRYCTICTPGVHVKPPRTVPLDPLALPWLTHSSLLAAPVTRPTLKTIELSHEADAAILRLWKADHDILGYIPIGGQEGLSELLRRGQVVGAYFGNLLIGYAAYTLADTPDGLRQRIQQAVVFDAFRFSGIGTALVQHAADIAKPHQVVANVRHDLAANHFWKAIGFTLTQQRPHKTSGALLNTYERMVTNGSV